MWIKGVYLIFIMTLISCTNKMASQPNSPQHTLSEYVSRSFGVTAQIDKNKLLELTTGEVKKAIESLSDAQFRSNFLESKREFKSLKIKDERKVSDSEYSITYEISFSKSSPGIDTKEVAIDLITNKKNAIFVKAGDHWLISEVKNLKTYIEHQNEMSF